MLVEWPRTMKFSTQRPPRTLRPCYHQQPCWLLPPTNGYPRLLHSTRAVPPTLLISCVERDGRLGGRRLLLVTLAWCHKSHFAVPEASDQAVMKYIPPSEAMPCCLTAPDAWSNSTTGSRFLWHVTSKRPGYHLTILLATAGNCSLHHGDLAVTVPNHHQLGACQDEISRHCVCARCQEE